MRQLTKNVFVDVGPGRCNPSFVATSEGVVMVDTHELPTDALAWREEILKRGGPRYLINCEHHGDHIVGNFFFSPPAIVISHQGTRDRFEDSLGSPERVRERISRIDPGGTQIPGDYRLTPPTVTYTEQLNLYVGEQEVQVIHMPGHTPNQTVVWVPGERVLMAGGNLSCRIMPAMWGSRYDEWFASLDRMEALQPDYIIPVHGEVCDLAYLRQFRSLLRDWVEQVRQAIAQGWSKEETAKRVNFLGPFIMRPGREPFGQDWQERNTMAIYEHLTGSARTEWRYFSAGRYAPEVLGR